MKAENGLPYLGVGPFVFDYHEMQVVVTGGKVLQYILGHPIGGYRSTKVSGMRSLICSPVFIAIGVKLMI
jgi:hypothetical protein